MGGADEDTGVDGSASGDRVGGDRVVSGGGRSMLEGMNVIIPVFDCVGCVYRYS